ncbi:hypothetical protein [Aequorivita echinoideorum]|uniref:Uncharacterized protein n=1 Tax=Aequorivita echinoideorum TaxID=1549647 RepID=A0ABS5S308_9FLAO|nr:hypothetical protein [Aequorivita echinoideorum]MBT0607598.1 hypothetical protein [Aequorivita echinoideorum]
MKKVALIAVFAGIFAVSLSSCRDKKEMTEAEETVQEMQDKGADIDVSEDGDKIKMETEDEKVKIKTDDDGNMKIKEKDKD